MAGVDDEAENLWAGGRAGDVVAHLDGHDLIVPADNLQRWTSWQQRLESALGADDPSTLTARSKVAHWAGKAGNSPESLRLFRELLSDQEPIPLN